MKLLRLLFLMVLCVFARAEEVKVEELASGVYKLSLGPAEKFTPLAFSERPPLTAVIDKMGKGALPFAISDIIINKNERGCSVAVPLKGSEQLYGFGLQTDTFQQQGMKRRPLVNDIASGMLGYSHAPQTFYVSTAGYGILVNTAHYTTFHCGSNQLQGAKAKRADDQDIKTNTADLYRSRGGGSYVFADIPNCQGIEVLVITGNNIKNVVEKYNLLSGGGCLPPLWGLGIKYRVKGDFKDAQVLAMSEYFRDKKIPCDVLGLEPGWQTKAYSCSYVWSERFPKPDEMLAKLKERGFRLNLWEHAYVHSSSPIFNELSPHAGNFLVWGGLVPDFITPEARKIFSDYHQKLLSQGVSGFKLDECDNSNIAKGKDTWGFPDMSIFPSGIDGERMHQLFGSLYARTLDNLYRKNNLRTYQDYRSSTMFTSAIPAVLYSDMYNHEDYIRMISNSGFGGLLWSPELRESASEEEMFHRLQTVLLSSQALVNSWYLKNPPWLQFNKDKNNADQFLANKDEMENQVRALANARMSLIPYLYASFNTYRTKGTPPFRALVMDYPADPNVFAISDQYLIGDNLMAAPLHRKGNKRQVYFPDGTWYNFNSNERYEGGKTYEIETKLSELPLYVKAGSILPLAAPVQHVADDTVFALHCRVYGGQARDFILIEDDGVSYDYEKGRCNEVTLSIVNGQGRLTRNGGFQTARYTTSDWSFIE
jgi:alpha-D-xyloside xylohydrolase